MARFFTTLVAVAAVLSQVSAAPLKRDSTIGEPAFSASGGVVKSETPVADYAETSTSTTMMMEETAKSDKKYKEDSSSSSMMEEETSTSTAMMYEETSTTMMMDETSTSTTMMYEETSTSTAYYAAETTEASSSGYYMPKYGSGSNSWGGMGYNNCVQQCIAEFGQPSATYTAQAVEETATPTSNEGTGSTITIIVAPTQGVLRYLPFAVNASVGDTLKYVWGAGPHTVSKSSALTPCNATADNFFTSGRQNKSFTFTEVVNDTDTLFFYCSVPGHCQKGMFGIVNPPNGSVNSAAANSVSNAMTVGSYMVEMASQDSKMAALWGYVSNKTAGTSAENWGMSMQLDNIPQESWSDMAQNVMYTQLFYAANEGLMEKGVGASDVTGNGIIIPSDITQVLASLPDTSSTTDSNSTAGAVPAADAASVTASGTASAAALSSTETASMAYGNGSGRLASSTALVGAIAILASFVML